MENKTCASCDRHLAEKEYICANCGTPAEGVGEEQIKRLQEEERKKAIMRGDKNTINRHLLDQMLLTTECNINLPIESRLGVITGECAFGVNIFRDVMASAKDITGGRSKATEKVLRDARELALLELKQEALERGANAVVAVKINYSEFSGANKSMLLVVATGTAVTLAGENELG